MPTYIHYKPGCPRMLNKLSATLQTTSSWKRITTKVVFENQYAGSNVVRIRRFVPQIHNSGYDAPDFSVHAFLRPWETWCHYVFLLCGGWRLSSLPRRFWLRVCPFSYLCSHWIVVREGMLGKEFVQDFACVGWSLWCGCGIKELENAPRKKTTTVLMVPPTTKDSKLNPTSSSFMCIPIFLVFHAIEGKSFYSPHQRDSLPFTLVDNGWRF